VIARGVIFDLDGVLVRTDDLHFCAWRETAAAEGLAFDRAMSDRLRGRGRADSLSVILRANGAERDGAAFERILASKNERFRSRLAGIDGTLLCPGVVDLLAGLGAGGVPMAVASSSRNAREILSSTGIAGAFACVVDGTDTVRTKPEPEVFLRAAAGLGLEASACVVVEDAAVGVEAALAAGARVLGVGPAGEVGRAHRVVGSLAGLDAAGLLRV